LFYEDVASTLDWLADAFGFVEHLRYTDDDGSQRATGGTSVNT